MTTVADIKNAVKALPEKDFSSFSTWFDKFGEEHWDRQIENDQKSGPLRDLMEEALEICSQSERECITEH
jgi:hypothetical protein